MPQKILKIVDRGNGYSLVYYPNGVQIGELLVADDGYWGWWPDHGRTGYVPEHVISELADILKERNAKWDAIVQNEVGKGSTDLWPIRAGPVIVGGLNKTNLLRVDSRGARWLSLDEVTALRDALSKSIVRMQEIKKWL